MKYAIIDLPLESIHSAAFRGAEMVRCAGEQGKFWEMRDRLFANPQAIGQAASHATAVGLDSTRFAACLSSGKFSADIRRDMAQAQAAGVEGTPSFFLAVADPATGKLKPVRFISGAQPFANFKALIDAALAEQGGAPEQSGTDIPQIADGHLCDLGESPSHTSRSQAVSAAPISPRDQEPEPVVKFIP